MLQHMAEGQILNLIFGGMDLVIAPLEVGLRIISTCILRHELNVTYLNNKSRRIPSLTSRSMI